MEMATRRRKRDSVPAAVAQPPAPQPLTAGERAELLAWRERIERQARAPRFKPDGKGALTWPDGADPDLHFARIAGAFVVVQPGRARISRPRVAE
jgi:hypothetical protein